ncbi:MAG: RDD family protein [Lentisphaerae bacterium]|nr:RDD family protein [Lentisphaerota bacterium]MBT4823095.1 RDD family protein [Lentisphaerota bacterium]MBT5605343.1 RDD family protein [Lentisphaerota bacterium]MBT7055282.1 RDD family protein [Lentisphaerota bacterium]MBT7844798.1 RDD family protein [Lentisphaerota bacterium]
MPDRTQHVLTIRTPEGVTFSLAIASPISRFLAWVLDALCIALTSTVITSLIVVFSILNADLFRAAGLLVYFLVSIGYSMILEWCWQGQTVGKRLVGLRVINAQGTRLKPHQVVMRNLLRAVDFLPAFYLTGGAVSALSRNCQRLGDIAAGTIVIRNAQYTTPDLGQLTPPKYNSFRDHQHIAARLRQKVTPAEAAILLQALMRRETLELEARLTLFRELAQYLTTLAEFPQEATDGLSDEQCVRNAVEVIYRTSATTP